MHLRPTIASIAMAVLIAALHGGSAAAQDQGQAQSTEFQSYRIPGWSFTPALAVGVVYDTNVALSSPRASIGETQGDSVFNIVPGGQLEFLGKRTDFSVDYRGFLRRHVDVTGLDGFDQRASVGFKHAVSRRLSVFASDSYADTPTTDEVELNGVPFRRAGSQRNTFAAGTDVRLRKFTTWYTRYDLTWVSFEQPDVFLTGGYIHGLRNELAQQVSERIQIGGEHSYRTASLDEGTREFTFNDFGGVVRFAFGPHTQGTASAGFATLHDRNADTTRHGPYVRLGLAHDLERATVGVTFQRQYVPAFGFGGSSSSEEIRGFVRMPVARNRVYTQLSGGWRRTIPFEIESLQLDTFTLRSTVGWAAARWARVEGVYTYTRQDSIVTGGEVDRHRVGVQFVVSQPMRIR